MGVRFCAFLVALALVDAGQILNLPGAPSVSFKQFAGYFDVGTNHHMHYWFTESQSNPSTDPVILWLTGGPGCSGLSALLTEIGPLLINPDGRTLRLNQYSWSRNASILILESPAGVGYSYSDGSVSTDDEKTSVENREALVAFFKQFPAYQTNDFYVIGESYAGKYVPTLVQKILDKQSEFNINIKGMGIGNGLLNDDLDTDTLVQFAYNHGMIDESTWQRVESECCDGTIDGCKFSSISGWGFCGNFVQEAVENCWYSGINPYNIYADCSSQDPYARKQKRFMHEAFMRTGKRPPVSYGSVICLDESPVTTYLNLPAVRIALFVPSGLPVWDICNDEVGQLYGRIYPDMTSQVKNAVTAGLRVLIYNGDADMACNFLMGQRFVQMLGYKVTSSKQTYKVNGQVGGFHTRYGNIDFVTVRGSGHMVPTDKPAVALHLLDAFMNKRMP